MKGVFLGLVSLLVGAQIWAQTAAELTFIQLQATQPTQIHTDASTATIDHLRWDNGLSLAGSNATAKAQSFMAQYGAAFGMKPGTDDYAAVAEMVDLAGKRHVCLQHQHQGVPVFAGLLNFHFDTNDKLVGFDGTAVPDIVGTATPVLNIAQAQAKAELWLRKHHPEALDNEMYYVAPSLQWYRSGLVYNESGPTRLAYYVEVSDRAHVRDYLVIDANTGQIIDHYEAICELAERELYLSSTNNLVWQDGDNFPGELTDWQQEQLESSEETYYLFKNAFGRLSYDGLDGDLRLVDQASYLDCPNASWNGYSTNYCEAVGSDDVVGHEWSHAYTEFSSNLLYAWQAGAINEAFADIWGETLDLLNSDPADNPVRNECGDSDRWLIGEEAAALGGAIRDLWNPTCYGKPGKVSDPEYHCDNTDFGGVHTNSGVVAHAYVLLVDGGEYNGQNISSIGLDKAAHIFWHAQMYYLGRTSDFINLAAALEAAAEDLEGVNLPMLTLDPDAVPDSVMISTADRDAVAAAVLATEMRLAPNCPDHTAALAPGAPNFCTDEATPEFTPFYTEDFENGTFGWLLSAHPTYPEEWQTRHWALLDELPEGRDGYGMFATNAAIGDCDTLRNNGFLRLQSPEIEIPASLIGDVFLTFDHYFSLEDGIDGGNLKVQQNNGNWQLLPSFAFEFNAYTTRIQHPPNSDNPLAGQRVFTGADEGSVAGTWGTTQINLSVIGIHPGETLRIRWEMGVDACDGWEGWYIDDIQVGTCRAAALPVEWLSFNARLTDQKTVQLHWRTAAEENNAGFTVQRSVDGRSFMDVDFVAATTEPQPENSYAYLDTQLPVNANELYYRLRQEDVDGTISYSALRQVVLKDSQAWQTFPNPATDELTVSWPGAPFHTADVRLFNIAGQPVLQQLAWRPEMPLRLAVNTLPAGIYLLQVRNGEQVYSKRVIVN